MSSPFAPPHVAPAAGQLLSPPPAPTRRRPLGALALIGGILATVLAPAVGGFAGYRVGQGAGPGLVAQQGQALDLRVFSPVRDLVLVVEIAFWAGTLLGIAALVVGIVATVRGSGRAMGIVAIVLAVLGPIVFGFLVGAAVVTGIGTSDAGLTAI